MIPKVIHQVWIGPHDPPTHLMDGWRLPGWDYQLWCDDGVDLLGLRNRRLYEAYLRDERWCGAVNVARVEILERHGGIYIDADTEMVNSIDGAPWLGAEMVAVQSVHDPSRISNAVMGGVAGAPGLAAYRRALSLVPPHVQRMRHPSWKRTGAGVLGRVGRRHSITVIPAGAFFPETMHGEPVPYDGTVYGHHLFGTTRGWYPPASA